MVFLSPVWFMYEMLSLRTWRKRGCGEAVRERWAVPWRRPAAVGADVRWGVRAISAEGRVRALLALSL